MRPRILDLVESARCLLMAGNLAAAQRYLEAAVAQETSAHPTIPVEAHELRIGDNIVWRGQVARIFEVEKRCDWQTVAFRARLDDDRQIAPLCYRNYRFEKLP